MQSFGLILFPCSMVKTFSRLTIFNIGKFYPLQLGIRVFPVFNNDLANSFQFIQFMFTTNDQIHSYDTRQSGKLATACVQTKSLGTKATFSGILCQLHLDVYKALWLYKKILKLILLQKHMNSELILVFVCLSQTADVAFIFQTSKMEPCVLSYSCLSLSICM